WPLNPMVNLSAIQSARRAAPESFSQSFRTGPDRPPHRLAPQLQRQLLVRVPADRRDNVVPTGKCLRIRVEPIRVGPSSPAHGERIAFEVDVAVQRERS